MDRGVKIVLLSSILLIPAAIYIFLQAFGHNEFSLPVYQTVDALDVAKAADVNETDRRNHLPGIPVEEDWTWDQSSLTGGISIVEFITSADDIDQRNRQMQRIADLFAEEPSLQIIRVFEEGILPGGDYAPSFVSGNNDVRNYSVSYDKMVKLATEKLGLYVDGGYHRPIGQLVLLDRKGRIRGYYTCSEFEEMDRLVLELKILIKQDRNV